MIPLTNHDSSEVVIIYPDILWKIKFMFQTINQIYRACSPEIPLWNLQEVQGFSIAMVWPGDRVTGWWIPGEIHGWTPR